MDVDRLRNLRSVQLRLKAGLTILAGRNGQGKTSLLEAVYLLGVGRSFRTRKLDDVESWSGGPLRVAGRVAHRVGVHALTVIVDQGRRRLIADGLEVELEEFLGRLDVIDLTSSRMQVVRGEPTERRRFLDRGITGLDPSFLRLLGEYRRVLLQRNTLLRRNTGRGGSKAAEIAAWDDRLVEAARPIHDRRQRYALQLALGLSEPSRRLFGDADLRLRYRPSPAVPEEADPSSYGEILATALERNRDRDSRLGYTSSGPHRDDLAIELDEIDLRRFGSAGQARASLVALKLAKLGVLQEDRGESPLFLMDDFDSDLDEVRAAALAGYLHERRFQALVATSKEAMVERLGMDLDIVHVDEGSIRPV